MIDPAAIAAFSFLWPIFAAMGAWVFLFYFLRFFNHTQRMRKFNKEMRGK